MQVDESQPTLRLSRLRLLFINKIWEFEGGCNLQRSMKRHVPTYSVCIINTVQLSWQIFKTQFLCKGIS
jgi:hypothetical protein